MGATLNSTEEKEVADDTQNYEIIGQGPARPLKFKVTDRLNNEEEGYVGLPDEEGEGHKLFSEINYDPEEDVWVGYGLTHVIYDPVRMEIVPPEDS